MVCKGLDGLAPQIEHYQKVLSTMSYVVQGWRWLNVAGCAVLPKLNCKALSALLVCLSGWV